MRMDVGCRLVGCKGEPKGHLASAGTSPAVGAAMRRLVLCAAVWATVSGCGSIYPVNGLAGAGTDTAAARSSLQTAIAAQESGLASSRAALAALPADDGGGGETPAPGGLCKLGSFRWVPGRGVTANPDGWAYTRRAEADAYGAHNVQWLRSDAILHAKFNAAVAQDGGAGVSWYTFSRGAGAPPKPELAPYRWTGGTVATDATGTWTRWRRAP